jgi:GNAT superfamily N-acetyltransferase
MSDNLDFWLRSIGDLELVVVCLQCFLKAVPNQFILMQISQRAAGLEDLEWLESFYESVMRPYVELTHEWDRTKFRESFDPKVTNIIQVDGIDIGMMKVEAREDCIYLGDIQIECEYRGRGIGTKLIAEAIELAIIANKPIRLRVLKGNPARELYLRLGFREILELDNCYMTERSDRGS